MSHFLHEWGWIGAILGGGLILSVVMIAVMKSIIDPDGKWW